ncbi:IS66 family insertion sequence element accessory protein TnpB [Pseudoxanthomonas mexicana]
MGVWPAARRLNSGKFVWPRDAATTATLSRTQFDVLVLGLPWKNVGEAGVITVLRVLRSLARQSALAPMRECDVSRIIFSRDHRRPP